MINNSDFKICFSVMTVLTILVGLFQSWGIALSMLNLCLISAVMAMGVNIQWGFAGLINFGVMGFLAIGGLATVLISVPPVPEAWSAGGIGILISGLFLLAVVFSVLIINKRIIEINEQRKDTQPQKVMTAGSTFKNPFDRSELKAWQLIDKAGLREYELNGVSFSEKHANFIVNRQKDSANLIEDFGENIKKEVKSRLGIELEWEIKVLGNR